MQVALLIIHLLIAAALVTLVLFQQSEGGALGMGGGGGGGGFMSGRGTANLLTRITASLAAAFFCTSILLTILANRGASVPDALKRLDNPTQSGPSVPGDPATSGNEGGVLGKLKKGDFRLPKVPDSN